MRFSITALIVLVAYVAFYAAAWTHAGTWLWRAAAFSVMWATLLCAVLAAIWWRGRRQALAIGFLLFGFAHVWLGSVEDPYWFRAGRIASRPLGHVVVRQLSEYAHHRAAAGGIQRSQTAMQLVGHSAATLLAGGAGSLAALVMYRLRAPHKDLTG